MLLSLQQFSTRKYCVYIYTDANVYFFFSHPNSMSNQK